MINDLTDSSTFRCRCSLRINVYIERNGWHMKCLNEDDVQWLGDLGKGSLL